MQAPPEQLGSFYLGAEYDLDAGARTDKPLTYDARDLVTHAVCVGMTGSGKTGLCIGLLEEAALDKVPAILIDPKGDITNLLLTFPELLPEQFKPWVNEDDARRKNMTLDAYAEKTATDWRAGLADWGQSDARIRALKEAVDFTIFTPGSDMGVGLNILGSLAAPKLDWETEAESIRERISGTVAALLGLAGVEADAVRDREGILLSNIFEFYWRKGEDLDLAKLILAIQKPPVRQMGVFDVDTFYPEKERFGLAMSFNNLVASPKFQSWLQGEPLDIDRMLFTADGKPRHSVIYIAHLSDAERMFVVTLIAENLLTWMRKQSGTTSLRALFYFDEIFGYFPPTAEPPSKRPLLTLLKQARAFGLGIVLVTQNPVDLDYKGLTNAGTWFIGKLQAERDKERVLSGLKGALSGGRQGRRGGLRHADHPAGQPRLPHAQRPRRRPGGLQHALGHELSARPPDAAAGADADGGPQAEGGGHPPRRGAGACRNEQRLPRRSGRPGCDTGCHTSRRKRKCRRASAPRRPPWRRKSTRSSCPRSGRTRRPAPAHERCGRPDHGQGDSAALRRRHPGLGVLAVCRYETGHRRTGSSSCSSAAARKASPVSTGGRPSGLP